MTQVRFGIDIVEFGRSQQIVKRGRRFSTGIRTQE